MIDLCALARGQPCLIRIPEVCKGRTDTVCGRHVRVAMIAGGGEKPTNLAQIYACQECDHVLETPSARPAWMTDEIRDQLRLYGLCRTLEVMGRELGL